MNTELDNVLQTLAGQVLGQSWRSSNEPEEILNRLAEEGPLAMSLWWDSDKAERQSLVLQELRDDRVIFFDPSDSWEGQGEGEGLYSVSRAEFNDWFNDRDAVCQLPEN